MLCCKPLALRSGLELSRGSSSIQPYLKYVQPTRTFETGIREALLALELSIREVLTLPCEYLSYAKVPQPLSYSLFFEMFSRNRSTK